MMPVVSLLYVSTSRKPTQKTRILAKWLARLFGGEHENRGKRSVSDIASRMHEKGFKRAIFVYEKHGNPYSLNFLDVEDGWLFPEVLISGFEVFKGEKKRIGAVTSAQAKDSKGEKILQMLGFKPREGEGLAMVLSSTEISFMDGRESKIFSIKIKGFSEGGGAVEGGA